MKGDLTTLSAVQAAEAIRKGQLTSEKLVAACLERIEATDPTIKAWVHVDADQAMDQARQCDKIRKSGKATGPLHGVPVGLKDIVDTVDMPTERGSAIFKARTPDLDARLVERLREAGAVIIGKTRTTELAYLDPCETTNPHDASRSPAGSSSGSAAAVAARQVPLAVGTQTGGSVIRPASFCGTFGFKPSRGVISRTGIFRTSVSLDQVGVFGQTLEDVGLLSDVLGCYDQSDPASFARPRPGMLEGSRASVPVEPNFCWFDLPYHDRLSADAAEGLDQVLEALGDRVDRMPAAPQLAALPGVHKVIYDYELAANLQPIHAEHGSRMGTQLIEAVERGSRISEAQYEDALEVKSSAETFFFRLFNDYDAILSPSASGEAIPLAEGNTGDAIYCVTWTLAGLPCLSLPLLVGSHELPIGVQMIGAAEEDDRLLRSANWLLNALSGENSQEN